MLTQGGDTGRNALLFERASTTSEEFKDDVVSKLGLTRTGSDTGELFFTERQRESGRWREIIEEMIDGEHKILKEYNVKISEDWENTLKEWLHSDKAGQNVVENLVSHIADLMQQAEDDLKKHFDESYDYGIALVEELNVPTWTEFKEQANIASWHEQLANPYDAIMQFGTHENLMNSLTADVGEFRTREEIGIWVVANSLERYFPEAIAAMRTTADNTDPANPDNCPPGLPGGSYGTYNVLETVG